MIPRPRVFVGIGSNLSDPRAQVCRAIAALAALPRSRLVAASALYRTAPWGIAEQPAYVNAVVELDARLTPQELLAELHREEQRAGRRRRRRWGPRVLDLDILAFGSQQLHEPHLEIPHPRIPGRSFVLVPWAEIAPDFQVPGMGRVDVLVAGCDDRPGTAPQKLEESACTEAPATLHQN